MRPYFHPFLFILIIYSNFCISQQNIQQDCSVLISGLVSDSLTKIKLHEANVVLFEMNKKDFILFENKDEVYTQNPKLQSRISVQTDASGVYKIKGKCDKYYRLITTINGFLTKVKVVSTLRDDLDNVNFELENQEVYLDSTKRFLVKTDPVEFEINSRKVVQVSKKEVQKVLLLLKKYPKIEVEIGVHASSLGNDTFNAELTQKRADYIHTYLNSFDWQNKERLSAVGYGESKLLNKCSNGIKCSPMKHKRNKRVEFLIQNKYVPTSNLNYLRGNLSSP